MTRHTTSCRSPKPPKIAPTGNPAGRLTLTQCSSTTSVPAANFHSAATRNRCPNRIPIPGSCQTSKTFNRMNSASFPRSVVLMQSLNLSDLDTLDIVNAHGAEPYGYVYLITNQTDGRRYVGQTRQTIADRFTSHKSSARHNPKTYLHCAIAARGVDAFVIRELFRCHNQRDLDAAENYYIFELDTISDHDKGYNLTWGGCAFPASAAKRQKLRSASAKVSRTGWHHTEESKEKISAAQRGRPLAPEHADKSREAGLKARQMAKSPEARRKRQESMRAYWANPENRARHLKRSRPDE
jgi:group I intron endonuclease